jgi:hypothetical protein
LSSFGKNTPPTRDEHFDSTVRPLDPALILAEDRISAERANMKKSPSGSKFRAASLYAEQYYQRGGNGSRCKTT